MRTWQRWLLQRQTRVSQQAYQIASHTDDMTKLPPEVHAAMRWAIDTNGSE